ncbi:hypothetical protein [Microbulbifer sp. THAF38]|uniref:hypothetical protein n=1 Tax=Microbulbifer sp. THAF38 TaxID=2587856 RepID=UPI001268559D|nr:hypothetical protein [Microbulbifer sp. THAF38]QFT56314.1 hypothetical protein FIU95_17355 [Microbulbifer sp. THAF38]
MKLILKLFAFTVLIYPLLTSAELAENSLEPKEEVDFAKDYLNRFLQGDFDYVKSLIDPVISDELSPELLERMLGYVPEGKLLSTELIGSEVKATSSTWTGNFVFEYHFEGGWALANAAIKRAGGKTTIIGLNVYRTSASQKELNRFSLFGKLPLHYLVLATTFLVPIFILVTLVICIKTPIQQRKWLWILFILFSVGAIKLNWTTGAYQIKLLSFHLFGGGAVSASEHAPLILTAGFPLGAIVFWFKRRSLIGQIKKIEEKHTEVKEADTSI